LRVSIPAVIDDGDPGYSQGGPWSAVVGFGGFQGDYHYAASGNGSAGAIATWQVSGLAPGAYDVQMTWTPSSNRASNAPYRIYDGATLILTVRVDQRQAPLGPTIGGVAFQTLGVVTLSNGALRVELGNDADNDVIADALRVALALVPPVVLDDGQAGYSQAGPWVTAVDNPSSYGPTYRYAPAGDGSATATWLLDTAGTGHYDMQVTWTASTNRASNAPYRIYVGTTLLRTVRVDQRRVPSGPLVNGVAFQSLGIVTATGGQSLRVVLGNDADSYVIADAARALAAVAPAPVDDGQAGYSQAGPWTTAGDNPTSFGPTYRYAPAGDGSATATWLLDTAGTGHYEVQVTWTASTNRASNAPYRIYVGTTLLRTVRVDQRRVPSGPLVNGVAFQSLGIVTATGGQSLRVVLGNDADSYVIADAARALAAVAPAPVDDGQAGYSQAGPWTTAGDNPTSFGPTYRYAPAGDGSATASWLLDASPGSYEVQVTWTAATNRASNAPYRIYAGTTLLRTVRVDQRRVPSGPSVDGVTFQSLGFVTVAAAIRCGWCWATTPTATSSPTRLRALASAPPAPVDDGQAGYSQAGPWTTAGDNPTSFGPTYRYAPAGDGSATATWLLDVARAATTCR
jgi:hypothetical protein